MKTFEVYIMQRYVFTNVLTLGWSDLPWVLALTVISVINSLLLHKNIRILAFYG